MSRERERCNRYRPFMVRFSYRLLRELGWYRQPPVRPITFKSWLLSRPSPTAMIGRALTSVSRMNKLLKRVDVGRYRIHSGAITPYAVLARETRSGLDSGTVLLTGIAPTSLELIGLELLKNRIPTKRFTRNRQANASENRSQQGRNERQRGSMDLSSNPGN